MRGKKWVKIGILGVVFGGQKVKNFSDYLRGKSTLQLTFARFFKPNKKNFLNIGFVRIVKFALNFCEVARIFSGFGDSSHARFCEDARKIGDFCDLILRGKLILQLGFARFFEKKKILSKNRFCEENSICS